MRISSRTASSSPDDVSMMPEAAGVGHRRRELRAGDPAHRRLHDRVLDAEQLGDAGAHGGSLAAQRPSSTTALSGCDELALAASIAVICSGAGGRPGEMSLQQRTSESAQLERLLLRLDAFGDADEAEAIGDAGNRGDDRAVLGIQSSRPARRNGRS